jgi:uncharacterized membrane protein YeaQ/YmgE (transglycosylase-associated protein family)
MGEFLGVLFWGLAAGIVIGPLARLVLPGKQDISLPMTIVVGAVGAILGGLIAGWLGVGETSAIDWIKHAIQVAQRDEIEPKQGGDGSNCGSNISPAGKNLKADFHVALKFTVITPQIATIPFSFLELPVKQKSCTCFKWSIGDAEPLIYIIRDTLKFMGFPLGDL